jgi:protein-S-isoprenylcysteine O-methyltransferase Ste14
MLYIFIGASAFALFIIYDINGAKKNLPVLKPLFGIGLALLTISTAAVLYLSRGRAYTATPLFLAAAALFLALTIYSLFFALPFKSTYADGRPPLCTTGMYALCRHPGVLWLSLMYAALYGALPCGLTLSSGLIFSALDILYALFQDVWTFPRIFEGYGEYRRTTPFLIPDPASVRRAISGK